MSEANSQRRIKDQFMLLNLVLRRHIKVTIMQNTEQLINSCFNVEKNPENLTFQLL